MSEESVVVVEQDARIPLDVWCQQRSETDRRVELLAAFYAHARQNEALQRATESDFATAFFNFCNQPA